MLRSREYFLRSITKQMPSSSPYFTLQTSAIVSSSGSAFCFNQVLWSERLWQQLR
jgi:hypothetical protein